MGFITGLTAIDEAANPTKKTVTWLGSQLKPGQEVKVRFVNELSADSPNYSPERGLAGAFKEHAVPKQFPKKAACTKDDEDRCFACELHWKKNAENRAHEAATGEKGDYKGEWRAIPRFYINALVDDGVNSPYVAVWSQGVSEKSQGFQDLKEYFQETGSVSNVVFKMKRRGEGTNTTYKLTPLEVDTEPYDWTGVEQFDLSRITKTVPYAEQEAFYLGLDANVGASSTIEW